MCVAFVGFIYIPESLASVSAGVTYVYLHPQLVVIL